MRLDRVRPLLLATSIVAIVAACSSTAATAPPTASPTVPAASLAPASAALTVAPTVAPTGAPTETPIPTIGNVSGTADQLSGLNSYKVSMTTVGGPSAGTAEFIVIRKPVLKESYTLAFGGKTTRLIVIDQDTWFAAGTGTFSHNTIPAAGTAQMTSAFEPAAFLAAIAKAVDLASLTTIGVENKNGIESVHLRGDENTRVAAGKPTIPPGALVHVWVSTNPEFLVALEWSGLPSSSGAAASGQIEVTNVNDPTLDVLPPT